jgi:hypothetical protein
MTTYWHVAHDSYREGLPLISRDRQDYYGIQTPWKWDADEGLDSAVICLFPDTPQGRQEADWLWFDNQPYALLRVEIDEDEYVMTEVEEGYPAVHGEITARDITVVRRGYAEGFIGEDGVSA